MAEHMLRILMVSSLVPSATKTNTRKGRDMNIHTKKWKRIDRSDVNNEHTRTEYLAVCQEEAPEIQLPSALGAINVLSKK